ncbi:hypothetical protein [Clostridium sp.]|uniref:hypothetical protein n=1 Tax=Clostridium sp. TaxID=1506 RepID=UPI0032180F27
MYTKIQGNLPNNYCNNVNDINSLKKTTSKANIDNDLGITTESDTIKILENNKAAINGKKAQDAYADTLAAFADKRYPCGSGTQDITGVLATIASFSQSEGIVFSPGASLLDYIDNLAEFGEKFSLIKPNLVPSDFFTFCEEYKNNLIKYDYR